MKYKDSNCPVYPRCIKAICSFPFSIKQKISCKWSNIRIECLNWDVNKLLNHIQTCFASCLTMNSTKKNIYSLLFCLVEYVDKQNMKNRDF